MLNGKIRIITVLLVLFCWTPALAFFGGKITEFSADQISMDADGSILSQGVTFVTPDKIRVESKPAVGNTFIMIFRKDKNVQWMLDPAQKTYFQNSFDDKEWQKIMQSSVPSSEKVLGTETVSGFKCTKKEVVYTASFMGITMDTKSIIWISDKIEAPLRTQMEDGSVTELRNIKKGSIAAKNFELPRDYKQVEGFGAMGLGMGMGTQSQPSGGEMPPEGGEEESSGFKLPEGLKLPEGFKFPFGNN